MNTQDARPLARTRAMDKYVPPEALVHAFSGLIIAVTALLYATAGASNGLF